MGEYDHLDDPAEREWLTNVAPSAVLRNAHRFYDFMTEEGVPVDSYTREMAFTKAAKALGISYDTLYDAWLSETAVAPETDIMYQRIIDVYRSGLITLDEMHGQMFRTSAKHVSPSGT